MHRAELTQRCIIGISKGLLCGALNIMAEEQKTDNNPKIKIANIEKILPEIEKKLVGREKAQAEYSDIKLRMPILKNEFFDAEEKYIKFKNEITQVNKRAMNLYLQTEPSPFIRFYKKIQYIWKVSKTLFFILSILVAVFVINSVNIFYRINNLELLSLEVGFTVIGIILWIRFSKYRQFSGSFVLGMLIFIYANYVSDPLLRWTVFSLGIAIIALGLAFQSFSSGEFVEQRIGKIEAVEKKLDEILKMMQEQPKNVTLQSAESKRENKSKNGSKS